MLVSYWIRDTFEDIWYYSTMTCCTELLGKVLLSIGAILISIPILAIDLLISPVEIIVFIVWKYMKLKRKKRR